MQAPQQPIQITIYNYIVNPEPPEDSKADDYLAWLTLMAMEARAQAAENAEWPSEPPQATRQPQIQPPDQPWGKPPSASSLFNAPVADVQIIPGLPNPNSDKIYRLQVGAYSAIEGAARAMRQLQAAGFDVAQEQAGSVYRVLAVGIPAQQIYSAAQRLGAIGFKQIWVRE